MQGGIEIAGLSTIVIPVFVSNLGCPHRCVFCDQAQFSAPIEPEALRSYVEGFISHCKDSHSRQRVLAFFGGSFTGIPEELFNDYLGIARTLISQGLIHSVKASTRPDMISAEILKELCDSGFEELEIGVQSMDNRVLGSSFRGHLREDVLSACALVKESGLKLGVQIMPGLPDEDVHSFMHTVDEVVKLKPYTARIYPTVVLEGTGLEKLYNKSQYKPLSLDDAVNRALYASIRLEAQDCKILRMGLPVAPGLKVVAGPFHEAFGFLVKARGYKFMIQHLIERLGKGIEVSVHPRNISELLGYQRSTFKEFTFSYSFDDTLPSGYIRAYGSRESACLQLQDILEYIL